MEHRKILVSPDARHLIYEDGQPFFYLADTAWEIFHRTSREQALLYLNNRAAKGFTAIQAVALAEFDGLTEPNAYGRLPLKQDACGAWDPAAPDTSGEYSYWAHVDFVLDAAAERGLCVALLPTWGDKYNRMWGTGPEVFTPENAYQFGLFLGRRWAARPNLIWVLGGDRPLITRKHFEVNCALARGLREADGGAHLITFHPTGGQTSSAPLHEEAWLDFNMIQSGHTRTRFNYEMIARDLALEPRKPVLDAEPGYEDHPEAFEAKNGYLDAADARQFAYMALLSGACGHTYGNNAIWPMTERLSDARLRPGYHIITWSQALDRPGAGQMRYAKDLLLAHDFLSSAPHPALVPEQMEGVMHIPVLRGRDFLAAYASQGQPIRLRAGFFEGKRAQGHWFDPRCGQKQGFGPVEDAREQTFTPPSGGRGNDWVLLLAAIKDESS